MINTKMSRKLVFTKNYAVDNLNQHEKTLFCLLGETWYDHSDLFDESFVNQLVEKINSDIHISSTYCLTNEDKILLETDLSNVIQNTKEKKDLIRFILNNIESNKLIEQVPSWNILSMFSNVLNYECHTLVIFGHPEPNFTESLDMIINDDTQSLLHKGVKDFIKYFPSEYDSDYTAELNAEDFSFEALQDLGINFAYEIPIYTAYNNLRQHKQYWSEFMLMFYERLLTVYDNINVISIGCSDEFNDMLKRNSKKDVTIFSSIFTINKFSNGVNINMGIAAKLGELLAAILYELDLEMNERNKILTYV